MNLKKITWIMIALLLVFSMVLAACKPTAPEEEAAPEEAAPEEAAPEEGGAIEAEEATPTPIVIEVSAYGEAPMLAAMVEAGELPPVDERLPEEDDILVVEGVDGIGEYGGIWHGTSWGQGIWNIQMTMYESPINWKADYTGYEPGLLSSWDFSDDGMTVTWNWRKGIKWSDGEPFVPSVDMGFWWEMANDENIGFVTVPWWGFKSDGEPMDLSFPDDYTMVMSWDKPQYITPYITAQGFWEFQSPMMRPKHFLSQFHPDYTDGMTYEDLELHTNDGYITVEGYPCLLAWCVETVIPGERTILARNPYYWKVDAEGNQLPYIDKMDISILPDAEVRLLEASQGKYEATFRATDNPNHIPFLLEQAEAGDYYIHEGAWNGAGGWPGWLINQNFNDCETYPDTCEEIRALLQSKDFRQGLSYAMDRQRLIDVAWSGVGYPTNATISPQAWHFASDEGQAVYEAWRDAYVEYDPDLAMSLFDAAGFVDADGDGFRDLPSGAAFTLVLDLGDWGGQEVPVPSTESYAGDLADVGIQVLINDLKGQPDWDLRQTQALYMLRNMHASELDIWTFPDWIFPLRDNRAWPMEGKWRQTGGAEGWEPTGAAKALQDIYDAGLAEPDIEKRHQLVYDAIQIHIDEGPFMLGAAGDQNMPVVVRNGFMGIPDLVILGPWAPGSPGNLHPEQFWMQAELRAESEGR